jgi:dTDP-4-amino-4,6-dideoxygalactose transaminase
MIKLVSDTIDKNDINALIEWLSQDEIPRLTKGELTIELEKKWAEKIGTKYSVFVNSGSSSILLTLAALKHKAKLKNFKVVVPSLSWATDLSSPVLLGLDPILCDCNLNDLSCDLEHLEEIFIKEKPAALILVSVLGLVPDMDKVIELCNKHDVILLEDVCESMGSKYKGKHIGNHGNMTMYSLQAIKHITAIDGGLLLLPHQELYDRAKLLRWYGIDRNSNRKDFRCEADIQEWGFKFHMNDVCATVGMENLKHADEIVSKHQSNAKFYDENLQNIPGLTTLTRHEGHESAFWIYSMLVENRDGFYKHMKDCGIVVSQVHERNDKHTCVSDYKSSLPTLDKIIGKVVSIPVGWWVTDEDRQYIVDCIKKGW